MITARLAGEQGREVFAVPGSPLDVRCHGSNNLLREGAVLTENAYDVMQVLRPLIDARLMEAGKRKAPAAPAAPPELQEADRRAVIELLGPVPVSIDELIAQSGAPVQQVHLVLLELELAGRLVQEPDGRIALFF